MVPHHPQERRRVAADHRGVKRDPVTPAVYNAVLRRDRGCVAPRVCGCAGEEDPCAGRLTLDHVKDQPMMGKRAPSDPAHLATLCWHHHLGSSWATSHRPELRAYLAKARGMLA